jgi:hypothetical protein
VQAEGRGRSVSDVFGQHGFAPRQFVETGLGCPCRFAQIPCLSGENDGGVSKSDRRIDGPSETFWGHEECE